MNYRKGTDLVSSSSPSRYVCPLAAFTSTVLRDESIWISLTFYLLLLAHVCLGLWFLWWYHELDPKWTGFCNHWPCKLREKSPPWTFQRSEVCQFRPKGERNVKIHHMFTKFKNASKCKSSLYFDLLLIYMCVILRVLLADQALGFCESKTQQRYEVLLLWPSQISEGGL